MRSKTTGLESSTFIYIKAAVELRSSSCCLCTTNLRCCRQADKTCKSDPSGQKLRNSDMGVSFTILDPEPSTLKSSCIQPDSCQVPLLGMWGYSLAASCGNTACLPDLFNMNVVGEIGTLTLNRGPLQFKANAACAASLSEASRLSAGKLAERGGSHLHTFFTSQRLGGPIT